jgi:hypothetical protein
VALDDYAAEVLQDLQAAAVAFDTLWESGQMPVLKYDNAFVDWRNEQIRENEKLVEAANNVVPIADCKFPSRNGKNSH